VWIRLEKINPALRQRRFYILCASQTLFGEWCLIREWGRIGAKGGQVRVDVAGSFDQALTALDTLKRQKLKRGYVVLPAPSQRSCKLF